MACVDWQDVCNLSDTQQAIFTTNCYARKVSIFLKWHWRVNIPTESHGRQKHCITLWKWRISHAICTKGTPSKQNEIHHRIAKFPWANYWKDLKSNIAMAFLLHKDNVKIADSDSNHFHKNKLYSCQTQFKLLDGTTIYNWLISKIKFHLKIKFENKDLKKSSWVFGHQTECDQCRI